MSRRNREKRLRRPVGWKRPDATPGAPDWERVDWTPPPRANTVGGEAFVYLSTLRVISTLDIAEYPDGDGIGPQWHVSVSVHYAANRRPSDREVELVLQAFGMVGAEEDNHESGRARHFWLPVDPAHRVDCECKETEIAMVEPDGHRWSASRDPAECAHCELHRIGIAPACRVHQVDVPHYDASAGRLLLEVKSATRAIFTGDRMRGARRPGA